MTRAVEVSLTAPELLPVPKLVPWPSVVFPGPGQGVTVEEFVFGAPLFGGGEAGHGGLGLVGGEGGRHPAVV